MHRPKKKASASPLDRLPEEASWLRLGQRPRAVTLLRAALAAAYRTRVEKQLARLLAQANRELNRASSATR